MHDRCGAAWWPSRWISKPSRRCVLGGAAGAVGHREELGLEGGQLLAHRTQFSAPSAVCGRKIRWRWGNGWVMIADPEQIVSIWAARSPEGAGSALRRVKRSKSQWLRCRGCPATGLDKVAQLKGNRVTPINNVCEEKFAIPACSLGWRQGCYRRQVSWPLNHKRVENGDAIVLPRGRGLHDDRVGAEACRGVHRMAAPGG